MTAIILDGKKLAEKVKESIANNIPRSGQKPGLGVILVGDNPASKVYVAAKGKFANECGMETFDVNLSAEADFKEVSDAINKFNNDKSVSGILLQLPLPKHLDQDKLIDLISPLKDADGLHPLNQGLLMRGKGELRSCTPLGSMRLIDLALSGQADSLDSLEYGKLPKADLSGKSALVIGRSILVGKPLALMLLERNATVTMAHSKTKNLKELSLEADILVAAIGKANFVPGSWIKPGAIVIDVGINRTAEGKLTGDVEFAGASERAAFITPVPKGVGPMTIAMLIENTYRAYLK
jgi:methylenetetrahydrofolate dehydrogenase (NADP+)/methenyltetrahydrofolate cyclohydrolase